MRFNPGRGSLPTKFSPNLMQPHLQTTAQGSAASPSSGTIALHSGHLPKGAAVAAQLALAEFPLLRSTRTLLNYLLQRPVPLISRAVMVLASVSQPLHSIIIIAPQLSLPTKADGL